MKNRYVLDTKKLKEAIKAKGLSPTAMAFASGVTVTTLHFWLTETCRPNAINLKMACDTVGLTVDEILIEAEREQAMAA